jgi:hypothetical protein
MRDVFTGAMSFRRLAVLLERLPVESEYKTELRETTDLTALPPPEPGSYGSWSQLELLVARLGDRMDHWLWMNADPKSRPASPPSPWPRPGVDDNVRAISPEALAYLEYVREHHGEAPPDDWRPATG